MGNAGGRRIDRRTSTVASASNKHEDAFDGWWREPTCRGVRPKCGPLADDETVCADCQFLHEQHLGTVEDVEFLRHCRAIREYIDQGINALFSPFVAAILVGANGRILDIDERSASYVRSSCVLDIQHNRLFAKEKDVNDHLAHTIERVSACGKPSTLICTGSANSTARYLILLQPKPSKSTVMLGTTYPVACFIFPLGRRRVASAQQLSSLFGLSPAEARLARALCLGQTLQEYADTQSVRLPTVKTQLRAIFAKTQTGRQVDLVNLISGIPPLR